MQCFYPLQAWQSHAGDIHFYPKGSEGKRVRDPNYSRELVLPCGQCIGCRIKRSSDWATRCMHEASLHEENAFITLTYDDDHLPLQGQLVYPHFQEFMKRLRYHYGAPIRFYMCGEYGENFDRPHYHAILFGCAFLDDRILLKRSSAGSLYSSALLDSVWKRGMCSVGDVTFDSAAYVARYVVKKVNGKLADEHYTRVDGLTGEVYQKVPEFSRMSLQNGGIGAGWLNSFSSDLINTGAVMIYDKARTVPRYYNKLLADRADFSRDLLDITRTERGKMRSIHPNDNSYERMRVKEEVLKAKVSTKVRNL